MSHFVQGAVSQVGNTTLTFYVTWSGGYKGFVGSIYMPTYDGRRSWMAPPNNWLVYLV
jgi:hypothetical protein